MVRASKSFRAVCVYVLFCFFFSSYSCFPVANAASTSLNLPEPTQFVGLSLDYSFPVLKGVKIDPKDPFKIEFIIDTADEVSLSEEEAAPLIKYFLAALTIPKEDIWVNLSPYEAESIIPEDLGVTDMGKDLLSQDYILKQLVSSLTYPETDLGKNYWDTTYQEVLKVVKTTNVPVNTFNKIWIVPETADIYENNDVAIITDAKLMVMLEEDYLAMKNSADVKNLDETVATKVNEAASKVLREVVLPKINEEINSGENFSTLRQIYHSIILGLWFKQKFQDSIYAYYIDQGLVSGIDLKDKNIKEKIYNRYVEAFEKGIYDYIKADYDAGTRKKVSRRYYSGGFSLESPVLMHLPTVSSALEEGKAPRDFFRGDQIGLVAQLKEAASPIEAQESSIFKIGLEPLEAVAGNIATDTSAVTAAILTKNGYRGKALGLNKKDPEQKKQISQIKDAADGAAKKIYENIVKADDMVLRVRVSEGFGRDEVAESFKANDVVNPRGKKGINDAIIDVIEGTNAFVTNVEGKRLEELKDFESGATSVIVTGPGVEALGNCPDYYVDGIYAVVNKENRQAFVDNPLDPEEIAQHPLRIEDYLQRLAEANNLTINDIEVVVMERAREAERMEVLRAIQMDYPGMEITTIKDGTVAHSLLATFGRKDGKLKVVMTVGGAPEGFLNLAVAGLFKEEGAIASLRIYSKRVNKNFSDEEATNLERRFDFSEKEAQAIWDLRPQDAQQILAGEKLFTQEAVKGDVEGSFSFITNNGVFKVAGVEQVKGEGDYKVNILRVGKINGRPAAWFEEKIFSTAELAKLEEGKTSSPITGKQLFDGLAASAEGKKAVVMAANIRSPLSTAGIVEAAKETGSVVVFQQAMSELNYTWEGNDINENAGLFVQEIKKIAAEHNFTDYVIKGDHVTVKVDKDFLADRAAQHMVASFMEEILAQDTSKRAAMFLEVYTDKQHPIMQDKNAANAMKAINKAFELVRAEVAAGMTVYALDASFMPMKLNVLVTAFLDSFIDHATASVEAEVGEIGGSSNSTVADALEFITGTRYEEKVEKDDQGNILYSEIVFEDGTPKVVHEGKGLLDYGVKISRLAINNGTAHGNNYDKDGNLIKTKMNLRMTKAISDAIAAYDIAIVQHGITGTPLENLPALRAAGITEGHVGTNWQNIIWEVLTEEAKTNPHVKAIVDAQIGALVAKYGEKYNVKDLATADPKDVQKLIGKELKNTLGTFKAQWTSLPQDVIAKIDAATKASAAAHFKAFGSTKTAEMVREQLASSPLRKPIIGANWKMNKVIHNKAEAKELLKEFGLELVNNLKTTDTADVVLFPTSVYLQWFAESLLELETTGVLPKGLLKIGAQNMWQEEKGAFTSGISADQLLSIGVSYVLLGHSEVRRNKNSEPTGESSANVNRKLKRALEAGLIPIVCVGESLREREQGRAKTLVGEMVRDSLEGISKKDALKVIVAYEPVWAIGTGETATPQDANSMNGFIRGQLAKMFGAATAAHIRIQYGGSVKPGNIADLIKMRHIDGGLVGGASENADSFAQIVKGAEEYALKQASSPLMPAGEEEKYAISSATSSIAAAGGRKGGIDMYGIDIHTSPASIPVEMLPFDVNTFKGFSFDIIKMEEIYDLENALNIEFEDADTLQLSQNSVW